MVCALGLGLGSLLLKVTGNLLNKDRQGLQPSKANL